MEKQLTGSYLTSATVAIDYVNELSKNSNNTIQRNSFTEGEEAIVLAYENLIKAKMNALPRAMERPIYINYKDASFAISGERLPLQLKKYADLSVERKAIVDALILKIFEVKDVNMTELFSKLGSDFVTINGVEYPFSDFNEEVETEVEGEVVISSVPSPAFVAAIQLATMIYNGI
jgi:hypothetical protein